MRRLAIALAFALAGCATLAGSEEPAMVQAVENAIAAWIDCGKKNATTLVRTRISTDVAAYAAIDACSPERKACAKAMFARLGPGRNAEIIEALESIRNESARDLAAQIADDRASMMLTRR